ncbi:hypothetical protein JTF06_08840 [Desemzia sp. RIT804]|uniref:hypothetical protein n=1 Tax=Desemzia sp. RIT 804 TaxID=2810209 RepID=UPI00194EADF2|nr:hypothetical protein [Desemzia sp. RIT 804]MBM6614996.1 hypothetical protein [Desemzia sp. RIT 804]
MIDAINDMTVKYFITSTLNSTGTRFGLLGLLEFFKPKVKITLGVATTPFNKVIALVIS